MHDYGDRQDIRGDTLCDDHIPYTNDRYFNIFCIRVPHTMKGFFLMSTLVGLVTLKAIGTSFFPEDTISYILDLGYSG